jgi:hypothetical protein
MLNYRKLAACPFITKHNPFMNSGAARFGGIVAPTRYITQNLTLLFRPKSDWYRLHESQRGDPCPFMDPIHPAVECYGAIAQSIMHTIQYVILNHSLFQTLEPLPTKLIIRDSGEVEIGGVMERRTFDEDDRLLRVAMRSDPMEILESITADAAIVYIVAVVLGICWCVARKRRRSVRK